MHTLLLLAFLSLVPSPKPIALEFVPPAASPIRSEFDHRHAVWTSVLAANVSGDRFDYAALAKDRSKLDLYLRSLEAVPAGEFGTWTREQQFAFWINAYNAYTISLVAGKYPVESIKDIGSLLKQVWDQEFIPLKPLLPEPKGERISLNDIEHRILRPKFKDARVHAAVNCASQGCPPLRKEAFEAEKLEAQLDEQVRAWLADPARNRYDREKGKIEVSQIFEWFEGDFVRDAGSVQAWIAKYAPPAEAEWIRDAKKLSIEHRDYSWKLNAK